MSSMVLGASANGTVGGPNGSGGIGGWGGGGGNGNQNGGGGGGGGRGGGPCGACKFLRRKCVNGCIFEPLFDSEQGVTNFAVVHKVFGASNIAKMLEKIPPHMRPDAVFSLFYEAQARICDPIYGCSSEILTLQRQVLNLQSELTNMQARLDEMELATQPTFVAQPETLMTNAFPGYNIPPSSNIMAVVDPSSLFDQQIQSQLTSQQQQLQHQQFVQGSNNGIDNNNDLEALEWELLYGTVAGVEPPLSDTHQ